MPETLATVSRHYDDVCAPSFSSLKHLDPRLAHHDYDFMAHFAVYTPARQPL
jgi:hypothetical protein